MSHSCRGSYLIHSFTICFLSILTCLLKKYMPRFLFLKAAEIMYLETMTLPPLAFHEKNTCVFLYLVSIPNQRSSQVKRRKTQKFHHFRVETYHIPTSSPPNFRSNWGKIPPRISSPPSTTIHPNPQRPGSFPGPFEADSSGAAPGVESQKHGKKTRQNQENHRENLVEQNKRTKRTNTTNRNEQLVRGSP